MDLEEDSFLLDSRCRLCRTTDASLGRISVFQNDRRQHQFVSEMISSCTAVKVYDHDRLPQHVCGGCLEELRGTYAFWKKCIAAQRLRPLCQEGKEEECLRCRICHVEECEELFSLDCPGSDGEAMISEMLQAVANVTVIPGDGLAPYVCIDCLSQLEAAREFQRKCLETEEAFLSDTIHPWEKMEFQEDQPSHLVVELFAKPLFESSKLVRCSVCGLKRSARSIKNRCEGCLLDFCEIKWPDATSEQDSPMVSDNEREADEEVELLVVLESEKDEESDGDWTPDDRRAKRPRMMHKPQLPVKRVPRKKAERTDKNGLEDLNTVPTENISQHLARLNLQMEDLFQIVSSPLGATHQTMRLKTFLCCGCNRFLLTEEAFRQHLREYHGKPKIKSNYTCGICNSTFGTKKKSLVHKEKLGSRLFNYCKLCDIVLLEEQSFVRHQMLNHLTDQQLQQIETQFLRFVTKKCRPVKSLPKGTVTCDNCAGKFATREDFSKHRIELSQFICQQKGCKYRTSNREFMIVHCAIGDHSHKIALPKREEPKEPLTCNFEDPPKHNEAVFEVELEGEIDEDDSPDYNPNQNESDDEQPERTNKQRGLREQIPDTIPFAKCAAWLKKRSLTMEDVFEILHSTPGGTHQYVRRKIPFCCACNLFIVNEEALFKHRERYHPKQNQGDPNLTCPICRTTLPTRKRFVFHRDKKDCLIYNYCIPCDRVLIDEKSFIIHHYRQHVTDRQRAKLEQQFAAVAIRKCKKYSQRTFGGLNDAPTDFRCPGCRRYFTTEADLEEHLMDTEEFSCSNEDCDFTTKNKMSMFVHCSIGDHRFAQGESLMKGMSFKRMATAFDGSMPVALERVENLSQAAIPSKKLQVFLKSNSLQMEDIFEVLGTIENSYQRCMKLRRKKPLCCACSVMFMTEQAHSAHMKKEHSARPTGDFNPDYVCKMCFTVCNTQKGFKIHTDRLQLANSLYTYCKICDCLLLSKCFAQHNMALHLTNAKLAEIEGQFTMQASFGCRDPDSLSAISEGRYVCACKCGKKFETLKSGNAHKGARCQDLMLYCKVEGCSYQTNRKLEMYAHCMEEAHETAEKDGGGLDVIDVEFVGREKVYFKCCLPKCHIRYHLEENLLKHFASAHGPAPAELDGNACRYCRESFSSEEDLRKHMDRRYSCKVYTCPNQLCRFTTEYLSKLQLHYKLCKNVALSKFPNGPRIQISEHFAAVGKLDDMIDIIEGQGAFCCGCRRLMENEAELEQHLREEHATRDPNRQFHCPKCNKGFKVKCIQESHVKESAERRYYYCRVCKITLMSEVQVKHHKTYIHAFDDPSDLTEFYDTVASDGLPCCGCDAKFEAVADLAEHCRIAHPPPPKLNRLMCPNCHQQQTSHKALTSHSARYGCPLYYKCKIGDCTVKTNQIAKIERHVSATYHGENERYRKLLANPQMFYCCIMRCTFSSDSYDLLIDHGIAEHEREREERSMLHKHLPIVCSVCCKGFDTPMQLTNHRNGAILLRCEVCSCKVKIPEYAAHLPDCRKTFSKTCPHCSLPFSTNPDYIQHFKKVHQQRSYTKRPKIICNICGTMIAEHRMPEHIATHENKRAWKCDLCPLRFNTKSVLSIHLRRVHTTERKYLCTVEGCGKSYRHNVDRIRHEMVVHFNHRPFACGQCSETFVRNRDLQLHMRQHTGRKLYCCPKCRADFDLKRDCVEHEKHCEGVKTDGDFSAYEEYIVEELV